MTRSQTDPHTKPQANSLPKNPDISLLKKQAKKLLKQYRLGDTEVVLSVDNYHPKPDAFNGLRDAQLVVARSYGFQGWAELSDAVELAGYTQKTLSEKASLFINLGCVQYNGNDTVRNFQRARNLLSAYPELAELNFYSALVANNLTVVRKHLESNPELALVTGGPLEWLPLFYVIYSRIGETADARDSLEIVRLLLDKGANPDTHVILNDTYRFTALTGAMGEGERGVNQPPHHLSDELATLLLDRGANPNEGQGLYNTMFTDSADKWLGLLISKGLNSEHPLNWDAVDDGSSISTLDYQLSSAVDSNRRERVEVLLGAGANPDTVNTYNGRAIHTNALLAGHTSLAQLLADKGAVAEELAIEDQFRLACVREDESRITTLLQNHPDLKNDAALLQAAAEHSSDNIVKGLIERGFDINGQLDNGRTLLHHFAMSNGVDQIRYLLALGARVDIRDNTYQSFAAGFAAFSGCYEAMRLLLDKSDNLINVVSCAYLERARVLLVENPEKVNQRTSQGNSALHIIGLSLHDEPDDEVCRLLVELLLSAGADLTIKNDQGQTPLEFNLVHGSEAMADLLSEFG